MARYVNGVLDLRVEETPPLIKYSLVKGDTFRRIITVQREGTDYTASTATFVLRDAKPPVGNIIYSDVTIPLYDVVLPVSPNPGSAKFTLDIPANQTINFPLRKVFFGVVRLLMPDASSETLFTLEINFIQQ